MSWVSGWRCDRCARFVAGNRDDFGPEGWYIIVRLNANGSWESDEEKHFCPMCPPTT